MNISQPDRPIFSDDRQLVRVMLIGMLIGDRYTVKRRFDQLCVLNFCDPFESRRN
jgi:hypothetical protein